MPFFEADRIEKKYKDFTLSASFSIEEGEFLSIIGPSGSGKSTLLSIIAGIERPDSGTLSIDGRNITDEKIQKRGISMVFQDFSLFPSMNTEKNIQFGMKEKDSAKRREMAGKLLEIVGLKGYEKRSVSSLSGGEAQRVALARAIAAEPRMILFDEPLSALDPPLRKHLRSIIRSIHDSLKITVIYVTHDIEEAFAISDRILVMKDGRVMTVKSAEELYRKPDSLFTAFFTGEGTVLPAHLLFDNVEGNAFFRPEDAQIAEDAISEDMYPRHIVLNDCTVLSADFSGPHYMLGLSYQGYPVLAEVQRKPRKANVSVKIPKDSILVLE